MNTKTTSTYKKKRDKKSKNYFCTHVITCNKNHNRPTYNHPKEGHQIGSTLENRMGVIFKWYKEDDNHE